MTRKLQAKAYLVLMSVRSFFVTLIPLTLMHAQVLPLRPLIPRAILFGQPEHTYPQLSPNGLQIAYERNVAGVTEVWVRTLGTNDDHAVTSASSRDIPGDKGNVVGYFWHGDGRHIFYQRELPGTMPARGSTSSTSIPTFPAISLLMTMFP